MAFKRSRFYNQTYSSPAGQTTASRGAGGGGMLQAPGVPSQQRSSSSTLNPVAMAGLLYLMKKSSEDSVSETTPTDATYRFYGPLAGSEIPAGQDASATTGTPLSAETLRQLNRTPEQIAADAQKAGEAVDPSWWTSFKEWISSPGSK